MLKNLRKNSFKIPSLALVSCIFISTELLTTSVMIEKTYAYDVVVNNNALLNVKDANKFLIDAPLKNYDNIQKAEKIAGFKFKIPDFILDENKISSSFQIIKLDNDKNALQIFFDNDTGKSSRFSFEVFENDPLESLKKIENIYGMFSEDSKVEVQKESMNLGNINGTSISLIITSPPKTMEDGYLIKERQHIDKYFMWQDEGLWYCINYNSIYKYGNDTSDQFNNLSLDNIEKIATSLKYPENITCVNYSLKTEISKMEIYDIEDLNKAKEFLGFNPKFPLKFNEDINITGSGIGISGGFDTTNTEVNYKLDNFYSNKKGSITFTQEKSSKIYDNIKSNGYFNIDIEENNESKKIKVEKFNINDIEIFKYDETAYTPGLNYIWKENNIYYSVSFFGENENADKIVKNFVNSKNID